MFTPNHEPQTLAESIAKISILLVDDNPSFLNIGKMFLEEQCHTWIETLWTACSGLEAISFVQVHRPQLILLDVSMPNMNGLETAIHLKRILPECHIIMLTLLETDGYRQAALTAGADDLIDKSNLDIDLPPAIRRIMSLDRDHTE